MARSYLFIPGNHPAMIQNADVFGADALIFDLEDAVAAHEKDAARLLLAGFLAKARPQEVRVYVRINGLDTPLACTDLEAVVGDAVDGIVLPKAGLAEVMELSTILHNLEAQKGLEKKIAILPIVETAKSLVEVEEIAKLSRLD
ncbi:MAG TPA: aldolase/citrate lyase family protein, partial [Bacillota bacterium]|nr:aldolase/citrate lyase family protein [Bacillota bacterium]